ncbi:hypothetical protein EJB05_50441, partial [Eragrostis curvula]
MLLPAEKFSPPISSGLRSLLAAPRGGGGVVTRALAAASSRVSGDAGVSESRDVTCVGGDAENVNADVEDAEAEEEEGNVQDEEDGCWVSYGRREPRRRLPPPIPSLAARGALRRTRTHDGRLVIRIVPVVWRECIRARRRGGRLTMQLVERDDESPLTPRPLPAPIGARDDDAIRALEEPDDVDTTSPAIGDDDDTGAPVPITRSEGIDDVKEAAVAPQEMLPVVPLPRVPSAGCFEDVFKYSSMGGSALHQMPSLRMI